MLGITVPQLDEVTPKKIILKMRAHFENHRVTPFALWAHVLDGSEYSDHSNCARNNDDPNGNENALNPIRSYPVAQSATCHYMNFIIQFKNVSLT